MLNKRLRFTHIGWLDQAVKVLLGAAGISLLGGISIPLEGELDLTLQTLMVLLPAVLFGWKVGGMSVVLYMAIGAVGIPVFPDGGSGIERLTGVVGGFYFGFATAALVVGFLAERVFFQRWIGQTVLWLLGHLIILVMGYSWLASVLWKPSGLDVWSQFVQEMTSKIPGAVVKSALGVLIVVGLQRVLSRKQTDSIR